MTIFIWIKSIWKLPDGQCNIYLNMLSILKSSKSSKNNNHKLNNKEKRRRKRGIRIKKNSHKSYLPCKHLEKGSTMKENNMPRK